MTRFIRKDKAAKPFAADSYLGREDYIDLGKGKLKPPTGSFVQLSACEPAQYAMEQKRSSGIHGVFSYAFLETLAQVGRALSYRELIQWVGGKVKRAVSDQTPQLNITMDGSIDRPVLGEGRLSETVGGAKAYYSRKHNNWVVDFGAIHGISLGDRLTFDTDASPAEGIVEQVYPGHSVLSTIGKLRSKQIYNVKFTEQKAKLLTVAFSPDLSEELRGHLRAAFDKVKPAFVQNGRCRAG